MPKSWIGSSRSVLEMIDKKEHDKEINNVDLDKEALPAERALGMLWCAEPTSSSTRLK